MKENKVELRLSKYAEEDIRQILTYSLEVWGKKQFQKYQSQIQSALDTIQKNPTSGRVRRRDQLFPGGLSYSFGTHIIFFRIKGDIIEVVRILHQKMDFISHLPEDS
ncbi:MAG: type II toxin-antitoxin system RelE/ParE family toxin [Bacteroidota bacterium]